jgi:mono/diheme cytochrome c family protein
MSNRTAFVLGVMIIPFLLAGFRGGSVATAAGNDGQQQTDVPQAKIPKSLVIPPEERKRKNPVPKVPEAIKTGQGLFASQCTMCHGPKGKGNGDLATSLKMKMPDLSSPALQAKRTDGDLFYLITQGHGQMPGETRLVPQNRWEMIHYIRTLKSTRAAQ